MQKNTFEKNLKAIKKNRPELYKKLKDIDTNKRFEVFKTNSGINIIDKKNSIKFYQNPNAEVELQKQRYKKYREYPFLYLFGVDNGMAIKYILDNKKLQQLVVIEPEVELIYIVLNLIDFSNDLKTNKLLFLEADEISYSLLINLIHVSNAKYYVRVFEFIINSNFSEIYYIDKYRELFELWMKVLDYITRANGNDINDTFRGVKQHLQNLQTMLEYPKYKELLKKKSVDTAVIVSTGPSLDKQIPLLKKYQEKICILSVDASFPILVKHSIKPDFVFSMERDEPTSLFFKEVKKKEQKGVIFVCASLQHQSVIKSIKVKSKVIVMRPFAYNVYFDLHDFGYLCKGMSSANMAHEFATSFGFKQITFIGQDLAFDKDLRTHSKEHIIKEKNKLLENEIRQKKLIEVEAYGGSKTVYTNIYWNIFKNFIEHRIEETQNVTKTYNSTEGGARIAETVEIPFKEFLEKFAKEIKPNIKLDYLKNSEIVKLKKESKDKLAEIHKSLRILKLKVDKSFLVIANECKSLENLEKDKALEVFDVNQTIFLLEEISKIRREIEDSKIYTEFLSSIIQPLMYSMELEIAEIKVRYIDNPKDNQLKALQWILAHRYWLFSFSGVIENLDYILKENIE